MIKTILFDLDGTLLPMDQDKFIEGYFGAMAKRFISLGYDGEKSVKSVWRAIGVMFNNDGKQTNEEVFWQNLGEFEKVSAESEIFDDFYKNEFQTLVKFCSFNKEIPKMIKELKKAGYKLVLATNPVFPPIGTNSRIKWAGLDASDFDLITTYDNIGYCKPNTEYYSDIVKRLNLRAEECLMVGNDIDDDMTAEQIGMKVFLLTDCLINKKGKDITKYPNGNIDTLKEFLKVN